MKKLTIEIKKINTFSLKAQSFYHLSFSAADFVDARQRYKPDLSLHNNMVLWKSPTITSGPKLKAGNEEWFVKLVIFQLSKKCVYERIWHRLNLCKKRKPKEWLMMHHSLDYDWEKFKYLCVKDKWSQIRVTVQTLHRDNVIKV